jgi:serine phosphatase RsbU (regulator of sigma subunit)
MPHLPVRISEWLLQLIRATRAVAYLSIDAEQVVVKAGGDLDHYGLRNIACRRPASTQLPFLEGLLPLAEEPFLLRSIEMSSGRVADVHFFVEGDTTWVVFLDVTDEHDEARAVQQKAYDMTLLSHREARLRAQLQVAHDDLTLAHRELAESRETLAGTHRRLQEQLRDAERYVRAILPQPMVEPFAIDWRFIPSGTLGGDAFGYHWIDADHLAMYVLDVCGHGLKAALLSVSAANVLRQQTLPSTDFHQPAQVLAGMNEAFQMDHHGMMYFTLWYGVYEKSSRRLSFASGGHPPAILITGSTLETSSPVELANHQLIMGAFPSVAFEQRTEVIPESSRLYMFSDGIYEVTRPDETMLTFKEFVDILLTSRTAASPVEETVARVRAERGAAEFEDDVCIIEVTF